MENSKHNPQLLQKSSQLGCKSPDMSWEQIPESKHRLCAIGPCMCSGHLLAAREIDLEGGVGSLGTAVSPCRTARLLRNDYFCFVIGIIYTPFVLSTLRQIHSRSLCNGRGRPCLSQG